MINLTFVRAPIGEADEPMANFLPELSGEVVGEQLVLRVYGEEDYGLREEFDGKVVPFKGQQTYNELRQRYFDRVGSVFTRVTLRCAPCLKLEQTPDGWCVLKLGGAEYPHFDGLIDRLKAADFEAKSVIGRGGYDAVAIQITQGKECEAFNALAPIIANTI